MKRDTNASTDAPASSHRPLRQVGPVRASVWLLLAASLLLSLAVPLSRLWQDAASHLVVRVSLVPAKPHVGEPAQLVVMLPDEGDRAAVHGPWARLAASWDMVAMSMGARQVSLAGPPPTASSPPSFAIPLALDMPGLWAAHLSLTTPGRPAWQTSLRFNVLPPSVSSVSAESSAGGTQALDGGHL